LLFYVFILPFFTGIFIFNGISFSFEYKHFSVPGFKTLKFAIVRAGEFYIGSSNQKPKSNSKSVKDDDLDFLDAPGDNASDDLDFLDDPGDNASDAGVNSSTDDLDFLDGPSSESSEASDDSGFNDEDSEPDEVYKKVSVSYDFMVSAHEVTQGLYKHIMKTNPSSFAWYRDDYPVEQVSWLNCIEFCNSLSDLCGLEKCYDMLTLKCDFSKNGFRLPSEAEWEYMSRKESSKVFFFGNTPENISEYANIGGKKENSPQSTGLLKANSKGIYDVYGNVWEWCYDVYDERRPESSVNPVCDYDSVFQAPDKNETAALDDDLDFLDEHIFNNNIENQPVLDKTEKSEEKGRTRPGSDEKSLPGLTKNEIISEKYLRVIKGGGWGSSYYDCRSANKGRGHPDGHFSDVGFRIVRTITNSNDN
jgi:formylglycine-generating enzyme required for sulfatase activity